MTRTDLPAGNQNSGAPVQIGSVIAALSSVPSITASTANHAAHKKQLNIAVSNIGTSAERAPEDVKVFLYAGNDVIILKQGLKAVQAQDTSASVLVPASLHSHQGEVQAIVTYNGVQSAKSAVGTFFDSTPIITASTKKLAKSADGNRLEIEGSKFGMNKEHLSVTFSPAVANKVVYTSDTVIWVDLADTSSIGANGDALNAVVTKAEPGEVKLSSTSAQTGTIAAVIDAPALDASTVSYASTTSSLTLSGINLGGDVGDVKVYLMPSTPPSVSAVVATAGFSATTVTVTTAFTDAHVGILKAMVVVQGVRSVVSTVRSVTAVRPSVIHDRMLRVAKSSTGNILAIHGSNFGGVAANLSVALTPNVGNSILEFGSSDSVILLQLADSSGVSEGPLTAVVTRTDLPEGNQDSGSAKQIGYIHAALPSSPLITASTESQSSTQRRITITGSNFGVVQQHTRVYVTRHLSGSNDVDGFCKYPNVIKEFSSTKIVVALAPVSDKCVGVIKARVTVDSVSSSVQPVATLLAAHPMVTPGTFKVAQSASGNRVHINGARFLPTEGSIVSVTFSPAVNGKVIHITDTMLVVDLESTALLAIGEISAQVTHSKGGSSEMTVFGSIIAPTDQPTVNAWTLPVSPPTLTLPISGTNFGIDIDQIKVYVMDASGTANDIVAAVQGTPQDTLLSVSVTFQHQQFFGALFIRIAVNGYLSDMVQVATVVPAPVVSASALKIAQSASGNRLSIAGANFGTDVHALNVVVDPVVAVTVIRAQDTMLVVDVGATAAAAFNSGTNIKVAVSIGAGVSTASTSQVVGSTIAALASAPSITASTAPLSPMTERITIAGSNFGTDLADVAVYLSANNLGFQPVAVVESMTATELKVKVSGLSAENFGVLKAVVTIAGVRSALTDIATVQEVVPFVISASPLEGPVEGNTLVTLSGNNFQTFRQGSFSCYWGGSPTQAVYVNDKMITCRTPRRASGNATLSLRSELTGKTAAEAAGKAAIEFKFISSVFVADSAQHRVVRFNAMTGTYVDNFVQPRSGGLKLPWGMAFGPDRNFYVASGGTNQILQYHGSTGAFLRPFCDVPGSPRGVTFHYGDLYVVSALDQAVYRYNGMTGSFKGTHSEGQSQSGILKLPWAIKFDTTNNESYVSSEQTHSIVRFKPPVPPRSATSQAASIYQSTFDKVWTQDPLRLVTGFDFATDAVYAVSPNTKAIIQYNRATGVREHTWIDQHLKRPIDLFVLGSYVYVCSSDSVRIYHRASSEYEAGWKLDGMECASILRNADWKTPVGFK